MSTIIRAKINKDTLKFVRQNTKVSFRYIEEKTKLNEERIKIWEDLDSEIVPTINQAKALANCYRIPFAGLYMDSKDIPVYRLPSLPNFRSMQGSDYDDSAVNLAIIDILKSKNLFVETMTELGINQIPFDLKYEGLDLYRYPDIWGLKKNISICILMR